MPNWTKEQEQAIYEEGTNIIVSAGAGSGKTAVLSERALRIVKSGIDVDRLLILTFTKAAAYEMMIRIRKKIKKEGLLEQVEKIDKAYITTFDSFALSIVKKYHDILNISPSVSIIDESMIRLVKEKELDIIFDEYYGSNQPLFQKLISCFCMKDDKDLKQEILGISHKLDMKYNKKEYLTTYLENYFTEAKITSDMNTYFSYLKKEIKKAYHLLDQLKLELDGDYCGKIEDILYELESTNNYDELLNYLDSKLPMIPRGSSENAKKIKNDIGKILTKIQKLCNYESMEEMKNTIMATKDFITIIIDIVQKLDTRVDHYKKEHNVYEFTDISKLAIQVVKEHSEIREELKNYFYEIMIDEYQDTNDLQETFISLIANHNVYMVGDIKQSIYRFRNANPSIFKEKYDLYALQEEGIKIDLNKNFRSREEVLNDINLIFNQVMDDHIGGANYQESHQMIFGNHAYCEEGNTNQSYQTEILNYTYERNSIYTKDEIEAFIIASDIKNKVSTHYQIFDKDQLLLRDIEYSDFVILMDRSSKFDLYKKVLEYCNIPLTILKDENILNHTEIYLIKNLIQLLLKVDKKEYDEEFRYAFLSIGRSYLCSFKDQELFDYIINGNYQDSDIIKKIDSIHKKKDQNDLLTIIRELIDGFGFYQKAITVGNIDFVINDLEYIEQLATNLMNLDYTLEEFYHYLDTMIEEGLEIKLPVGVEEENSVKIMTIHKSKGLEYPICYYAGLHNKFNVSDLKERILFSETYGIIIPSYQDGYIDTIYKALYTEEFYNDEISEKIRLFYVALTRCKEKMILVTSLDEKDSEEDNITEEVKLKYRSFQEILKSIYYQLTDFITNIDLNKIGLTFDYKKRMNRDISEILDLPNEEQDFVKDFEWKEEDFSASKKHYSKQNHSLLTLEEQQNMRFGTKIHEAFENIDFKNPNFEKLGIDDFIQNKIKKFLDSDLLQNRKEAKIYKEFQFMDEFGTIGIIDCMLVYSDHIDIIDYKLKNVLDDNYQKQLNGYKNYIEKKTSKQTNIYLYSILDEKFVSL